MTHRARPRVNKQLFFWGGRPAQTSPLPAPPPPPRCVRTRKWYSWFTMSSCTAVSRSRHRASAAGHDGGSRPAARVVARVSERHRPRAFIAPRVSTRVRPRAGARTGTIPQEGQCRFGLERRDQLTWQTACTHRRRQRHSPTRESRRPSRLGARALHRPAPLCQRRTFWTTARTAYSRSRAAAPSPAWCGSSACRRRIENGTWLAAARPTPPALGLPAPPGGVPWLERCGGCAQGAQERAAPRRAVVPASPGCLLQKNASRLRSPSASTSAAATSNWRSLQSASARHEKICEPTPIDGARTAVRTGSSPSAGARSRRYLQALADVQARGHGPSEEHAR